jgi:peptidoglycan-associated lipoprotein
MRNKGWLAIALLMILPVMLFTTSCAKKGAQTQSSSKTEPEVQKAPEIPAEEAEPDGRLEEERLRAEAAAREAAAREAALRAFVGENIHFPFDSSVLSDQARQILISKAEFLRTNPDIMVTVEGHCDDRGTNTYNVVLGGRRAESVKVFLVDMGIEAHRLKTLSYGKERPVAVGRDEDSWAKNRRAQFMIN